MYMVYIPNSFKMHISVKIEPLKFRTYLLNLSFSRPLQLMKISSAESYVFFLALTDLARIQLIFTNTRGIQYSPYISLCVLPYRVPNLTLGTKYKYTNNIKISILSVPKHSNKHNLIHFVKVCFEKSVFLRESLVNRERILKDLYHYPLKNLHYIG